MGWEDDHLHELRAANRVVGMPGLEDELFGRRPALPEDTTTLGELLIETAQSFVTGTTLRATW